MRLALVVVLAVVGIGFSLTGAVGILRTPDLYTRIQCATKVVTMGALPLLLALAVAKGFATTYGARALLVAILLGVLNPAASHAIARAAYKTGEPMWPGSVMDQPRQRP